MSPVRKIHRALVLGGTGFIGSALIQKLLSKKTHITCLVHRTTIPTTLIKDVQILQGSIVDFNWNRLASESIDVIYHLARIPGRGKLGRLLAARRSAKANHRLLTWLTQQSNPPLLVYVAGTLSYGSHHETVINEDTPLTPASFAKEYARGEQPIVDSLGNMEIPVMIMRAAWVYGIGSWFKRFYLDPIHQFQYVPLYVNGQNWMSFIHVDDCAGMIWFLSEHGPFQESFNLFSGQPVQQKTFVRLLSELYSNIPIKQINSLRTTRKYGRATAAAFKFSLKVATKHELLYQNYSYHYPDLREGLQSILTRFNNI